MHVTGWLAPGDCKQASKAGVSRGTKTESAAAAVPLPLHFADQRGTCKRTHRRKAEQRAMMSLSRP